MTMKVTITNDGPEPYLAKVDTFDQHADGNTVAAASTLLAVGESTEIEVHSIRGFTVTKAE